MSGIQIAGMAFFIISMLIGWAGFGYSIYKSVSLVKDKRATVDLKDYLKSIICGAILFVVGFTLGMLSIYLWNGYYATWQNYLQASFGGLIFSVCLVAGINSFILHYYRKELPTKLDNILFYIVMGVIPVIVFAFFLLTDGYADMGGERFLLPNGINFSTGFVRPDSSDKPNLAFYALCILVGAVFVFLLSDHYLYKKYGKHGTIETTFISAFPAGIIGARIAYVIGNWTRDGFDVRVARGEWWSIFAIWEGGLTILGGAIAGIIVGVLVYIKTNKGRSIWTAVDLIVPTILIAQAIGRWGNFFNCEVHGVLMDEAAWQWLPRIIFNNAHYSSTSGWAEPGMLYVPLFFIEFLVNLFGYFVIAHLFGIKFSKFTAPGDLCFGYVIWYGYTRVFMEPLRDSSYNMGADGYWSWLWSLIFVAAGSLLIAINHIVRFILNKRKNIDSPFSIRDNVAGGVTLLTLSLVFIVVGSVLMASNEGGLSIALNGFNIGVIYLVSGVSLFFLFSIIGVELFFKFVNRGTQIE